MKPTDFPEANTSFGPPIGVIETQVHTIHGYRGSINRGSLEGFAISVVAWSPSIEDLAALKEGKPLFLSMIGGLLPHYLCTDFNTAINPA